MAVSEVMPNVSTAAKVDVVRLACGRVRTLPHETAPRPEDEHCCPECRALDDLRRQYAKSDQSVDEPTPVLARLTKENRHG